MLTLPGYGFYWFKLSREVEAPAWHEERLPRDDLPVLVLMDGWNSFRPERVQLVAREARPRSCAPRREKRVLPGFVAAQRWFAAKGVAIQPSGLRGWRRVDGAFRQLAASRSSISRRLRRRESGEDAARRRVATSCRCRSCYDDPDDSAHAEAPAGSHCTRTASGRGGRHR